MSALALAASGVQPSVALPSVDRRFVRERGLVGTLFTPSGRRPYAAVLCLAGLGPGLWEPPARALAQEGFVALALATNNAEGLPPTIRAIPIEYCLSAIEWLRETANPARGLIAIRGHSRGAELALILGAMSPTVRAVLAYAPRTYVGLASPNPDSFDDPTTPPAWTWRGKPVHFEPLPKEMMSNPTDPTLEDRFGIPVERTAGPIVFVTGTADRLIGQDPTAACRRAMRRLDLFHFAYRHEHWSYPDAGHMIGDPPPYTGPHYGGGTEAGTRYAVSDSWSRSIAFLKQI